MLRACAGKGAEDNTEQAAAEPILAPPQGLSLRERIAAAGLPEAEMRLNIDPTDAEQQAQQSGRAPIQEPGGHAVSPSYAPTLPRILPPDPAAELQGEMMLGRAHQAHAEGSDPDQAAPGQAAQTAKALDAPQRSALKRRAWPWLQQMLRDAGPALAEPSGECAAASPAAEQSASAEEEGGSPPGLFTRRHAEAAFWEGQPASAEDAIHTGQAPMVPKHGRQSPGHAGNSGSALAAAPSSTPPQKAGRKLMDRASEETAAAPVAAAPSLSLAERMRLAQADDSLQEHSQIHSKPSVPQQHLQPQGVRQQDAAAAVSRQHDWARDPQPGKSPGGPLRQRLQTRQQGSPLEAAVQPKQAPPKFSEGMHVVALSQQPLLQRLRQKSRSPDAHPELERRLEPSHRGPPVMGSREGGELLISQVPLANRLTRKRRSPDAQTGASGQPALKKAGHMSEASVQQIREQGNEQTPGQHILTEAAPAEHEHDWETQQDQLQSPQVHSRVQGAASVPQSAKSGAGQEATPELQWRRPKPHRHVLEDSSGKLPPSQSLGERPQQPEWDDSQTDQAAHCTASELGTPLLTHASSAAAAAAAGDGSTGLQWRRPLARRPHNDLNVSTPGMTASFSCIFSCRGTANLPMHLHPFGHGHACQQCTHSYS